MATTCNKKYSSNYQRRIAYKKRKRIKRMKKMIIMWCARVIFGTALATPFILAAAIINVFCSQAANPQVNASEVIVQASPILESPIQDDLEIGIIEVASTCQQERVLVQESEQETEEILDEIPEETTEEVAETEVTEEPEVVEPRISADGPGEVYYYNLSNEDKLYIAKTVYLEARGECYEGQVAVAAVVLNRYVSEDSFFKNDTIYSVVTQDSQFADISVVSSSDLEAYPDCMKAVEDACKGWDPTRVTFPETGATFFYDPNGNISDYQKSLREGVKKQVIGSHCFHVDFNMEATNN